MLPKSTALPLSVGSRRAGGDVNILKRAFPGESQIADMGPGDACRAGRRRGKGGFGLCGGGGTAGSAPRQFPLQHHVQHLHLHLDVQAVLVAAVHAVAGDLVIPVPKEPARQQDARVDVARGEELYHQGALRHEGAVRHPGTVRPCQRRRVAGVGQLLRQGQLLRDRVMKS